ncbi:MAG: hypothetical protein AAF502_13065 [Bacteroidota bacterium]
MAMLKLIVLFLKGGSRNLNDRSNHFRNAAVKKLKAPIGCSNYFVFPEQRSTAERLDVDFFKQNPSSVVLIINDVEPSDEEKFFRDFEKTFGVHLKSIASRIHKVYLVLHQSHSRKQKSSFFKRIFEEFRRYFEDSQWNERYVDYLHSGNPLINKLINKLSTYEKQRKKGKIQKDFEEIVNDYVHAQFGEYLKINLVSGLTKSIDPIQLGDKKELKNVELKIMDHLFDLLQEKERTELKSLWGEFWESNLSEEILSEKTNHRKLKTKFYENVMKICFKEKNDGL